MIKDASSFIDAKGGNAVVAQATGYQPGAIGLWRHRNRLPRSAWPEILKAFPDVKLDDLLAIEAQASKCIRQRN
jgi:hypothetical protein